MFNLISSQIINTKKQKKYDLPFHSTPEKLHSVLTEELEENPKYVPRTGTSLTNPYKNTFDQISAKNRVALEYYKNSKLWSPKFKPAHFTYLFLLPMSFSICFAYFSLNLNMPKKMMKVKKKLGAFFPEYEKRESFRVWSQEKYVDEIYGDIFQERDIEVYEEKYQALEKRDLEIFNGNKRYKKLMAHVFEEIALEKGLAKI